MEYGRVRTAGAASIPSPRYEPLLRFPPLSEEELQGLRDTISIHGVLVPILVDSDGPVRKIIDGNYRKEIADEFGCTYPETFRTGLDEEEKRTFARALNLARRQPSRSVVVPLPSAPVRRPSRPARRRGNDSGGWAGQWSFQRRRSHVGHRGGHGGVKGTASRGRFKWGGSGCGTITRSSVVHSRAKRWLAPVKSGPAILNLWLAGAAQFETGRQLDTPCSCRRLDTERREGKRHKPFQFMWI